MRLNIKENDIIIGSLALALLIFFIFNAIINSSIDSTKSEIKAKADEYQKVVKLYKKIKSNKTNKKRFDKDIIMFVQVLQKIDNIKDRIVSVNMLDSENLKITISSINLKQLVSIFKTIEGYENIKIVRFTLKRNFSNPKLANLNIVIRKSL